MKAIYYTQYGLPGVLKVTEIPKPVPKENELLIRVHATTINRTDCGIVSGRYLPMRLFTGIFKPRSPVPGTDFAGEVESVGKNVSTFKVGDRVWGLNDEGLASQAEYMTLAYDKAIALIPDHMNYKEAVACAEGAHYAYNFINKINIQPTDKVLINGATGGIGSASLQILKSRGIYVTAVGNTKNIQLLKSLGADKTFDYEKENFLEDTERYHFILDAVGKSEFSLCKPLLLPGGIYLSSELGPHAENLYLPLLTKFSSKKVIFPIPNNCKRSILYIKSLMDEGKFRAVIDREYTPEQIREAYEYVDSGQKTGNTIINF